MKYLGAIFNKIKKVSRKYKIILFIVIALVVFSIFSNNKKADPLQFASVKREDIREEIAGAGTLSGKSSVNLHFKTSGKLAFINVKAGDAVSKWQTIAGLDATELNIDLREAENTLRDKRAIVDKIKDDYKDVAFESYAQRQTRTTAEVAQDNAYEGYLSAKKALNDSVLYSPIKGIVTQALNVAGQSVAISDVAAQIVDNSEMYFDTDIDEADIGKIKIGLPAVVTLDAYPDSVYKGVVDQIVPQTKITTSGSTVITIRIKLGNAPDNFVNGLSGEAVIIIKSVENALSIPLEALREDDTVFAQSGKGLTALKVTTGISSDTNIEIKKGLKKSQRVLLNPPSSGNFINQNRSPLSGIFRIFGGGARGGLGRPR